MLDLSPIDLEAETLARSLPQRAKEVHGRPVNIPALNELLETPGWTGVSWAFHWRYTATNYELWKGTADALERLAVELDAGHYLLEKFLPDFGFGSGDIEIPYGRRGILHLRLARDNRVEMSIDGRPKASLPQPLKSDDVTVIQKIRDEVALLKRELRRVDRLLHIHLERALRGQFSTYWPLKQWREAIANPIFRNVASNWLWAGFGQPTNRLRHLFAIDESGGAVSEADARVELDFDIVRLASPQLLTPARVAAWGQWFADHQRQTDQLRVAPPSAPSASTRMMHASYLQHIFDDQVPAARAAMEQLGWLKYPNPTEDDEEVRWFDKQMPGEIEAVLFAAGYPDHINQTSLSFARDGEWMRLHDVPAVVRAEAAMDLSWAHEHCADAAPDYARSDD